MTGGKVPTEGPPRLVQAHLRFPRPWGLNACFGDGSLIDDEAVFQVHNAYTMEAIELPWRKGDILLLDNMLIAHGRNCFAGDREVLLAMGNPYHSMQAF